ncbi:restriction modification system DNA specificity domain protein [Nitrosococcus halophilus Nc 4]|uniref:Restriction modification system DNA specificity domain protein n=1 Tax=Nitrosococcus halophilus (strain Nc4) TaxID=472759 RepID=D5C182_NITHN|nr:restriction endonuclease subunit S [Nitrosococcus halophilus]ADE16434.1 restriction modification system DNA specificity domain protein [Nitrosococcus halophilus Nc 4]
MCDWAEEQLGRLASIEIGGTPAREVAEYWAREEDEGHPWVSIADLGPRIVFDTKERITNAGILNSNAKRVPKGTLMMSFKLTIGRVGIAGRDLYINEAIATIIPTDGRLDGRFLYYALPDTARSAITDTAVKGVTLNKQKLGGLLIRFPERLDEQQRIAEILSTVDEAIEHTEALIAKMQQIKAGLMHDLFTRGVTPDGQLRPPREEAPRLYKKSPLGWIPREWDTELLDNIALRGSGHTPSKNHPEYWNGEIKWISLADSWRLDRVHIVDTDHKITQAGIENSSAVVHPAGIVVLSRDAGVGKSAVTTCEMAVSQHFMCWRCGPRLNNYYLYYWLQYRKWEFENIATGSTIPTIGLRFFRHYRINIPLEVSEQEHIAATLLAADEKVFSLEDDVGKLRQLRAGLMHDLLTGRVPVSAADAAESKKIAANV